MIDDPRIASVPIEDEWIDEAAAELKSFRSQRFAHRFMKRSGLQPRKFKSLTAKIEEIKRCIRATDHPLRLDSLVAYLDELKTHGKQLVFLWRLKDGDEAYLADLSHQGFIRGKLGEEAAVLLNGGKLVWKAGAPVLAEVHHSGLAEEGILRFKWIVSRPYWIEVKPAEPGSPSISKPAVQRAAACFRVNLRNGDAELRIQSLPKGDGLPLLRKELERFQSEVEKLIDLSRFSPVPIEPVAHEWLRAPLDGLAITRWELDPRLIGGGQGIFSQLQLLVGDYFARTVTLRWQCKQWVKDQPLYFTLDGDADSIDFNGLADAARVDFLLDRIRQVRPAPLRLRELRELARQYPSHLRILASLDHFFATRKESQVSVEEVAKDAWYDRGVIRQVFELAAAAFPKVFGLHDDVLILRNRIDIRGGGLAEAAERYAKKKGLRAGLVKPILAVLTPIVLKLYDVFFAWLWPKVVGEVTGLPYETMQVGLVLLSGGLHLLVTFGGASARKAGLGLLQIFRSIGRWWKRIEIRQQVAVAGLCETLYRQAVQRKWITVSARTFRRRRRTPSPPPAAPPQPTLDPLLAGSGVVTPASDLPAELPPFIPPSPDRDGSGGKPQVPLP